MKMIRCDVCKRPAENYAQIKYRLVFDNAAGEVKRIDVCEDCYKKHLQVLDVHGVKMS